MGDPFQRVIDSLTELEGVLFETQRKQAQELAALSRLNGIAIFQSSNLDPYGVSILVGPKLWDFIRDASVDTHPKGGDPAQTGAPFMSGAVPAEERADAQTLPGSLNKEESR